MARCFRVEKRGELTPAGGYGQPIEGSGVVRLEDGSELRLGAGDVIVLPHGDPHGMCSGEGRRDAETPAILRKVHARDLTAMRAGGGGDITRFVCGYLGCDPLLCRPILH